MGERNRRTVITLQSRTPPLPSSHPPEGSQSGVGDSNDSITTTRGRRRSLNSSTSSTEDSSTSQQPPPEFHDRRQPDNYTDPNFLAQLELNPIPHNYQLNQVMKRSSRISLQVSACVLFYVCYINLRNESLQPSIVLRWSYLSSLMAHTIYQLHSYWPIPITTGGFQTLFPRDRFKVTVIYFICCYWLAPVLRTLTATISTDTVYACAISLTFIHLMTNDYGVHGFLVSKTISMNAAVIGSIFLSSRLPADSHAIALITLAMQLFVLFPLFSCVIWDSGLCLAAIVMGVSYVCAGISTNVFLVYICGILAVTYGFPLVFVTSQKFKSNVYGPWDEANLIRSWKLEEARAAKALALAKENEEKEKLNEFKAKNI